MRALSLSALLAAALVLWSADIPCAREAPQIGTFGFDEKGMDRSVKPGDDFFAYANGTWIDKTQIPADKPAYGSYIQMEDLTNQRLRELLEAAKADPSSKIGRAYASYLDTARVEALGLTPIRPWLDKIEALNDRAGYSALVAEADEMRIGGPLVYWIWQDDKQPAQAILMIDQAGIGLVGRNMYLDDAPANTAIRTAYAAHLVKLLVLAGETDAQARVQAVMALETEI
ncbi:MAG TPA: M13 family metallopeptidase N-terminal domain-containing protein, partial [Polyangiales bacterium]|nr:M13 family metallopeptidase N-terminal domain-containing protein [Polyangiales bacterium]